MCVLRGWVKEAGRGCGHRKDEGEYGCSEGGTVAVIKCPAGPRRRLPRPRAMLMSAPGGQGCLISTRWTIWWERRRTGGLTSLQMTNLPRSKVIPLIGTHWIRVASLPFPIISRLLDPFHTNMLSFCLALCLPSSQSLLSPIPIGRNTNI